MSNNINELPEINKRIRNIIDKEYGGNVLKFSKAIGLNSSSKINRLFNKDKRNNQYPDVSIDIIQRISNVLKCSTDILIYGFERIDTQKHVNNINIEANRNHVDGDHNIVSVKESNISTDSKIDKLLEIVQMQQEQINNLLSKNNM